MYENTGGQSPVSSGLCYIPWIPRDPVNLSIEFWLLSTIFIVNNENTIWCTFISHSNGRNVFLISMTYLLRKVIFQFANCLTSRGYSPIVRYYPNSCHSHIPKIFIPQYHLGIPLLSQYYSFFAVFYQFYPHLVLCPISRQVSPFPWRTTAASETMPAKAKTKPLLDPIRVGTGHW